MRALIDVRSEARMRPTGNTSREGALVASIGVRVDRAKGVAGTLPEGENAMLEVG